MKPLFALFPLLLVVCSCTKDKGLVAFGNYPQPVAAIISASCSVSGCHNAASAEAAGGLNLATWSDMFRGATNGSPVIPYRSDYSSLCYFINTYSTLGPQNSPRMPLNGPALLPDEVKLIKKWIDNGAPDKNGNVMWADNPRRRKMYVVNQGCDVVSVLDAATMLPMRMIDVGHKPGVAETPHQVRVSPDGNYWYVCFVNNNIVQKFRCSDDSYVGDIPLTPFAAGTSTDPADDAVDWNTMVISSDGKRAYCVSWTLNGRVAAIDLEHMKLLHYLPGFTYPHGAMLNAANDKLYVTAQTGNYISEIDTAFSDVPTQYSMVNGQAPSSASSLDIHDVVLTKDGGSLIMTCQTSAEVRVFDLQQKKVTHVIPSGTDPQEVIYCRSADAYFVSCTSDSSTFAHSFGLVMKINANDLTTSKIPVGFQPHGIAVDEASGVLAVASRNVLSSGPPPHHTNVCNGRNGFVSFVDVRNFTLLKKRYELGSDPYFISARR